MRPVAQAFQFRHGVKRSSPVDFLCLDEARDRFAVLGDQHFLARGDPVEQR
jgi:hypothetical protein